MEISWIRGKNKGATGNCLSCHTSWRTLGIRHGVFLKDRKHQVILVLFLMSVSGYTGIANGGNDLTCMSATTFGESRSSMLSPVDVARQATCGNIFMIARIPMATWVWRFVISKICGCNIDLLLVIITEIHHHNHCIMSITNKMVIVPTPLLLS